MPLLCFSKTFEHTHKIKIGKPLKLVDSDSFSGGVLYLTVNPRNCDGLYFWLNKTLNTIPTVCSFKSRNTRQLKNTIKNSTALLPTSKNLTNVY